MSQFREKRMFEILCQHVADEKISWPICKWILVGACAPMGATIGVLFYLLMKEVKGRRKDRDEMNAIISSGGK
jgi:hypothetical protein